MAAKRLPLATKLSMMRFSRKSSDSFQGVQYGDGIVGMMVINGPTTANYDEDLGVLPVSDW